MNTEKQQQDLVASIKHELAKENEFYKSSSFWHSVWFQPSSGRFLFADQYTRYEVVEPLIENKTLIFVGSENHQGEQMLRYVLSEQNVNSIKTGNKMKNLKVMITTLMMCLMTMVSFGQTSKDSVYVVKATDDMSGKTYVYGNRDFICANDDGGIGFRISTYINSKNLSFSMITATMVGIGGCNENDEIIILFENGEKITKKSWKKFNCDGEAYFNMNEKDIQILRTQPLSKIRMTNGRTYDSYTGDVKLKDKRYFIQLFYALEAQNFQIAEIK
jgi:hypothetical protein